ncbi:MAG: amidohydrolase family protein [Planctomycetota bacterium]|nr:amidohydrolase family protein [Planctomycetota bacterium]
MIRHALGLYWLAPLALATAVAAQAPPRPQLHAVRDVALGRSADAPRVTLILRNGRIESVLDPGVEAPPGARIVEGADLIVLPAFVDAYSRTGCETPEPVKDRDAPVDVSSDVRIDMRLANRKGIQPAFRAVDALAIDEKSSENWRKSGFGTVLPAPRGQLLAGTSVLAVPREAAARDIVIRPEVFAHAGFRASGSSYPSTLMGYIAQLRQYFLDVRHHEELIRRYDQGRPGTRPPFDAELEAGLALLDGRMQLVCEAESASDIERWMALSGKFGFTIAISGGGEAWKVADRLAAAKIPVFLTLDWGKEVDDPAEKKDKKKKKKKEEEEETEGEETEEEEEEETEGDDEEQGWIYDEPEGVLAERRRLWEEKRDNAIRLHEAGVRFVFGTGGDKPKELLDRIRDLVESGLPAEAAMEALTSGAAEIVGVERRLGSIEPGRDATFALWTSDPLTDDKAQIAWLFLDGFPYEFELKERKEKGEGGAPAEGLDVTGEWKVEYEGEEVGMAEAMLELEMSEDGSVTGTLSVSFGGQDFAADLEGALSESTLTLEGVFEFGGQEVPFSMTATLEEDELTGETVMETPWEEDPEPQSFTATRTPGRNQ